MHPADITAALKKAGTSQAGLARNLGMCRSNIHAVVSGRSKSIKVRRAISRVTCVPVSTLWPEQAS